jgi:hypothetical protein
MGTPKDKDLEMKQASDRAARIRAFREEVIARHDPAGEEKLRVEKRGKEWTIVRNSDGHPIAWCNSLQQARAIKKLIEKEYAGDAGKQRKAA